MPVKRPPLSKLLSYHFPSSPAEERFHTNTTDANTNDNANRPVIPSQQSIFPSLQQSPIADEQQQVRAGSVSYALNSSVDDDLGCLSPSPSPSPEAAMPNMQLMSISAQIRPSSAISHTLLTTLPPTDQAIPFNRSLLSSSSAPSSGSSAAAAAVAPTSAAIASSSAVKRPRFPSNQLDVFAAPRPVTCRSLNDIADSFDRDMLAETSKQRQVMNPVAFQSIPHTINNDNSMNRAGYTQNEAGMTHTMYQSTNAIQQFPLPHSFPTTNRLNMPAGLASAASGTIDSRMNPRPSQLPSTNAAQSIASRATMSFPLSTHPPKASNHFIGNSIQINQYGTSSGAFPFNSEDIAQAMIPQQAQRTQQEFSMLPPPFPRNPQPPPVPPQASIYRNQPQLPVRPQPLPLPSLPFHAPIPAARTTVPYYDNIPELESPGSFTHSRGHAPAAANNNPPWFHSPAIISHPHHHPAARTWIDQQSQQVKIRQQQNQTESQHMHRDYELPTFQPSSQSHSLNDESTTMPTPFRPDAKIGNTGKLDSYFGVSRGSMLDKMTTPRKRRSVLELPASAVAMMTTEKKKRKRQKRVSHELIEIPDEEDLEPTFEDEEESREEDTEEELMDTTNVEADSASLSSSSTPNKFCDAATAANLSKFKSLFSSHVSGYCGRAISYLKTKHQAQDLSDPSTTVLNEFHACMMNSEKWSMCIMNQDLSTNFRVQTKEQKKFLKTMIGEEKKGDEEQPKVWNGGIKPPTVLVVEFLKKKPLEGDSSSIAHSSSEVSTSSDQVKDDFTVQAINPYPYSVRSVSQYERSGLFILPLFVPINMTTEKLNAASAEINQIQHNWNVRREFLSLLQNPPTHIHGVLFDAKALICAVMIHFHLSSLDVDLIPRLNDALMAAWLCDPDDNRNTEFNIDALMKAYCPMQQQVQLGRMVISVGDKDVDVILQDMRESFILYDRLVERMHREQLIPACVRQELPLLPVVIDMQVRGVAVNNALFQQAEEKLKAKIDGISATVHEVAGHSICLASAAQVAKVLYDEFEVPPPKLTDKGRSQAKEKNHHTTNDNALRSIISDTKVVVGARKIAEAVLRFRAWYKILTGYLIPWGKSTVADGNLLLEHPSNQLRICPIWNQFATGTGRMSCCNPNLQATPKSAIKRALTLEEEENGDRRDRNNAEEDNIEEGVGKSIHMDSPMIGESMHEAKEARPVNLPIDINMRSVLVPTPAHIVQRIGRDRMATLDQHSTQLVFPADAINQAQIANTMSDRILMSADYSQMEVRLLAQLSKDPNLIRVFEPSYQGTGEEISVSSSTRSDTSTQSACGDVYRRMASIMFSKDVSQVSDAERNISKTIVLGVMYGMGADSLAGKLNKFSNKDVTQKDAQSYINKLYEQFPMVKSFMNNTRADGGQFGYVPTLVGRRRYLPDLKSTHGAKRAYAERQAVNTVIQGSAADMTKMVNESIFAQTDQFETMYEKKSHDWNSYSFASGSTPVFVGVADHAATRRNSIGITDAHDAYSCFNGERGYGKCDAKCISTFHDEHQNWPRWVGRTRTV